MLLLGAATLAGAQERRRIATEADLYKNPGEQVLGRAMAGSELVVTRTQGDQSEVRLEGWIFTRSLGATTREGYDLIITKRSPENLRVAAKGAIVARLSGGVLLKKVDAQGGWTQVQRTAWIATRNLAAGSTPAPVAATGGGAAVGDQAELVHAAPLLAGVEGTPVGNLSPETPVRVVGRSGDWARIQVEGWVKETDLKTTESGVLVGVTQAEVRASPNRFIGQIVEWRVQFIAVQKADELRPEIPPGQSYLLTRGPLPEPGFVYIILPPDRVADFQSVPPLQEMVIRGVIKSATSKYLPNPVLELVSVVKGLGS
jgi:hypothetical protein